MVPDEQRKEAVLVRDRERGGGGGGGGSLLVTAQLNIIQAKMIPIKAGIQVMWVWGRD